MASLHALPASCGLPTRRGVRLQRQRRVSARACSARVQDTPQFVTSSGAPHEASGGALSPATPPALMATRRGMLRVALACGCGAAAAPLLARPAGAVVLAPPPEAFQPQPTTWKDDTFAENMADGMGDYERGIAPLKAALFADAAGSLLEIGMGTGPSLRYFRGADSVVGVEPNQAMHPLSRAAAAAAGLDDTRFRLVAATAEALPFPDASFDTVVATMVMCSVRDMRASLQEVRRVLKPGGRFLFIEHVGAPRGTALRAMQTALDPLQQLFFCGCHLTRDPSAALAASGFASVDAARFSLGDAAALRAAASAPGGAAGAVAALRAAGGANAGAGWEARLGGAPPPPHFLLSPHIAGVATA